MDWDQPLVESVALRKVRYAWNTIISDTVLNGLRFDIDIYYDYYLRGTVVQMETQLLGDTLKEWKIEYPATWWDAVKWRFAPDWLLARWPARFTVHEVSARHVYPELTKRIPHENSVVHVAVLKQEKERG